MQKPYPALKSNGQSSTWKSRSHRKFISALGTLHLFTMHHRRASRTSENPTVTYVKGKSTFRTTNNMLSALLHGANLSTRETGSQILKILLNKPQFHTKILTVIQLLIMPKT